MFLANLLIALREGLEATLVVSILVAYLVKSGRRDVLPKMATGVLTAVLLSLAFGAILTFGPRTLTFQAQEIIGGSLSFLAVALTTGMVFWMSAHARAQKAELEGRMAASLSAGSSGWPVAFIAFVAVAREGLETALFVWATVKSSIDSSVMATTAGLVTGLVIAVILGVLIYRGAVRINLGLFFTITGAFLILVAAGIFAYGIGDFQEAGLLPGLTTYAWDVSAWLPAPSSPLYWLYVLLGAMFQVSVQPTVLQVIGWLAYAIPVGLLFFRATRRPARPAPTTGTPSDHSHSPAPHSPAGSAPALTKQGPTA
ncbi:MAG: iron uptake transporter permease EfeU [Dermabacter sp.]|nr:iron uptake transporter permease EfeU [Dermabacter sp.]